MWNLARKVNVTRLVCRPVQSHSKCTKYHNIQGLYYIPNFLSDEEHDKSINTIRRNPWRKELARWQQFYETEDNTPFSDFQWMVDKLYEEKMYESIPGGVFQKDKKNQPTQLLVNRYIKNQGIGYHVEDPTMFGDVLLTVSFCNPIHISLKKDKSEETSLDILLEPKSLLVLKDDARYNWFHGIKRQNSFRLPDDTIIERGENYLRYSITMRRVLHDKFFSMNKISHTSP
ncbi:hypothetical protein AKO1_006237 [Acrasis kona]|uniref:Alpha-ketoglutarate-dependent dioxygenase AlkB-like domain-containing protein n=1 Tax=Acrasis kona TaxID=1008807 RepID=A0AAW2YIZ7_9EUKA